MTSHAWKKKRAADAEALAAMRDAEPVDEAVLAEEARAKDKAVMDIARWYLESHPDHPDAPLWRAVAERGFWGYAEWREAVEREGAQKRRTS